MVKAYYLLMRVADLFTDHQLHLELATASSEQALARRIRAAIATESITPAGYIEPDTLILTTGIGLNFENAQIWEAYVERLKAASVSAIAFGVGEVHKQIPVNLVEAAKTADVPVIMVPRDVSFLHLQQSINRALAGERYWLSRKAWAMASQCIAVASQHGSVDDLLAVIENQSEESVAIFDESGHHFAGSLFFRQSLEEVSLRSCATLAISIGGETTWQFVVAGHDEQDARIFFNPAVSVLSMALSRQFEEHMASASDTLAAALLGDSASAVIQVSNELSALGLDISRGLLLLRLDAHTAIRRNLLAHRIHQRCQRTGKVASLQFRGSQFLLCEGEMIPHQELAQYIDPEVHDSLVWWGPAWKIPDLMLGFRRILIPPSMPGAQPLPGIDVEDVIDLIPHVLHSGLSESVLGPVLKSHERERYLVTLEALLNAATLTQAAEYAGVHRNTFIKDRKKLERKLGLDLGVAKNIGLCALALQALNRR